MITPKGSTPHVVKALNGTPVGTLANFSLDSSASPFDPRDSSAQIPTLSATLSDLSVPASTLIDDDITFRDWSGADTTAKVKALNGSPTSGLVSLETSTLYERLNTVQTTYPIIMPDSANPAGASAALRHWCLMAGLPTYATPGNLLQAIPDTSTTSIGYIADNPAAFRFSGPSDSRTAFVPTIGTYLPPLEVNSAQSLMMGAMFGAATKIAEFRVLTWLQNTQVAVNYIVRRLDDTYVVAEKANGVETVLLSANYTTVSNWRHHVTARFQANAADPTKVDITLRVMEWGPMLPGGSSDDIYTDFTASGVSSYITQRPMPYQVDLGYDPLLIGSRVPYGDVSGYFLAEGSVLFERFPRTQVSVRTSNAPEVLANDPTKIPGFTANVWEKIKEFCAIAEMDITFDGGSISIKSRNEAVMGVDGDGIPVPYTNFTKSELSWGFDNRETSKYVDITYRELSGDPATYTSTELWRAETVYSLDKGEYREEVVQTDSTFTVLDQPVIVTGVPVPYTWSYGAYVITGNDGYIVDPQWWKDNGGSVTVEATGKAGEIKIKLQAPPTDTVRAPYRISEGVADRPALYIRGSGLNLGKGKTLRIATGAGDAAQEAVTLDSPFITNLQLAYNVGYKVADSMGGAGGQISFNVPKSTLAVTSPNGVEYNNVPQGSLVYYNGAMHRVTSVAVQPAGVSVNKAEQFTSLKDTNDGLGPNATVDDWNNLHLNKTVKEVNLSPLPQYLG